MFIKDFREQKLNIYILTNSFINFYIDFISKMQLLFFEIINLSLKRIISKSRIIETFYKKKLIINKRFIVVIENETKLF